MSAEGEKRAQRTRALDARKRLTAEARAQASLAIARRLAEIRRFDSARVLGVYASAGSEVDTQEIVRRAHLSGKTVAWPRVLPDSRVLSFSSCPMDALIPGSLGILQPPASAHRVPLETIECLLVPGLAFDPGCYRLGRGGGYYDATLDALPPNSLRVGLAFEAQIVTSVPREAHDAPVDLVVTDLRIIARARMQPDE